MDDSFLDTSWSLHYHPINNAQSYRKIFTSAAIQDQLDTYSARLTTYLATQASQNKDDFDNEDEKLGSFQECRWSAISRPTSASTASNRRSITITLVYQKQTYKFILYSAFLTLAKASPTHTKRVFDFLTDTFGISLDVLKLSPEFLQGTLADYITTITEQANSTDDTDTSVDLNRLSILKSAVSNLKLTIAFSGPVAPGLKTIDLDIPHDTVDTLISNGHDTRQLLPAQTSSLDTGATFLASLAHYITEQTGLKLPLTSQSSDDNTTPSAARLSRVTTAFWVFSVEGKIKFSARVVDGALGFEDAIRAAGADILASLDREARGRTTSST